MPGPGAAAGPEPGPHPGAAAGGQRLPRRRQAALTDTATAVILLLLLLLLLLPGNRVGAEHVSLHLFRYVSAALQGDCSSATHSHSSVIRGPSLRALHVALLLQQTQGVSRGRRAVTKERAMQRYLLKNIIRLGARSSRSSSIEYSHCGIAALPGMIPPP